MPLGRLQTAIVDHLHELGKLTDEQTQSIISSPAELTGEALDQILCEEHKVSTEQLLEAVTDSARYDVFDLVDSALAGNCSRSLRILNGLQGEGTPPPVVLWALAREVRTLSELAFLVKQGRSPQQAVGTRRDIWDKRKPLVTKALQRLSARNWRRLLLLCGRADRTIKGREKGDPWLLFQDIAISMAGTPAIK